MFFAGLIIFITCTQFLPWYAASVVALLIGLSFARASVKAHLILATSAGVSSAACAFLQDGRTYGVVGTRMAGMFSLPFPSLIFVVMFLISFVSVFLWLRGGYGLRNLLNK